MKITQWNYFWLLIRSPIEIQFSQQEIMYNCELFHTSPKKLTIVQALLKRVRKHTGNFLIIQTLETFICKQKIFGKHNS